MTSTAPPSLTQPSPHPFAGLVQPRLGQDLASTAHVGQTVHDDGDIAQCIRLIVCTPQGADPLRPHFGCDVWQHIDQPMGSAKALIVRDVYHALWLWEPRIDVERIVVHSDGRADWAGLAIAIYWRYSALAAADLYVTNLALGANALQTLQ